MKILNCNYCGKEFERYGRGRNPLHCEYCKENATIPCAVCGKPIPVKNRHKFCSHKCVGIYSAKGKNVTAFKKVCSYCAKEYYTAQKTQVFCSVSCRGLSGRKHKGSQRVCKECGAAFEPKAGGSNYCGHGCAKPAAHKTLREKKIEKGCQSCGKKFSVDGAHEYAKYCSRPCRDSVWRNKRRAMEVAATIEDFPALSIYKTNNWYCQLCGGKVNKKLKHPHPKSASLDHIIPLSKGGKHSRDNVQLAHLVCNIKKGNRNIMAAENGQLMIV